MTSYACATPVLAGKRFLWVLATLGGLLRPRGNLNGLNGRAGKLLRSKGLADRFTSRHDLASIPMLCNGLERVPMQTIEFCIEPRAPQ